MKRNSAPSLGRMSGALLWWKFSSLSRLYLQAHALQPPFEGLVWKFVTEEKCVATELIVENLPTGWQSHVSFLDRVAVPLRNGFVHTPRLRIDFDPKFPHPLCLIEILTDDFLQPT